MTTIPISWLLDPIDMSFLDEATKWLFPYDEDLVNEERCGSKDPFPEDNEWADLYIREILVLVYLRRNRSIDGWINVYSDFSDYLDTIISKRMKEYGPPNELDPDELEMSNAIYKNQLENSMDGWSERFMKRVMNSEFEIIMDQRRYLDSVHNELLYDPDVPRWFTNEFRRARDHFESLLK